MATKKLFRYALIALLFNLAVLFFVFETRNERIADLQHRNENLLTQVADVTKKYDSTVKLYGRYFGTVYSHYRQRKSDTSTGKISIQNWASYYHYYESEKSQGFNFNLHGRNVNMKIYDLRAWFISEDEKLTDFSMNDSVVVTGTCLYSFNSDPSSKSDVYDFQSYMFNDDIITYYPSIEDNKRIYIHAAAKEFFNETNKYCVVILTEHETGKVISSIKLY